MDKPIYPSLTKTCSSCGLKKPLSAFLQLTGPEGTTYGSICSSCRKGAMDKALKKETDEHTTMSSSTGLELDAKAKVETKVKEREFLQKRDEALKEERGKKEEIKIEKTEKTDFIAKKERDYREKKSTSFLSGIRERPAGAPGTRPAGTPPVTRPVAGTPEIAPTAAEQAAKEAARELGIQEEKKLSNYDFKLKFEDTHIAGKLNKQGVGLQTFINMYSSSPIAQAIKGRLKQQQAGQKTQEKVAGKEEDPLVEFVEKNYGPKRTR